MQRPESPPNRLRQGALEAIKELNVRLLHLLCEKAAASTQGFPLPSSVRERLADLPSEERGRIAGCGVLLVDPGFSDSLRWTQALIDDATTSTVGGEGPWLCPQESIALAHATFLVGWYIVQANSSLAAVLLSMSNEMVSVYGEVGLDDLAMIARRHSHWIRPRWERNAQAWVSLLDQATQFGAESSAYATLRCLQLSGGHAGWLSAYLNAPGLSPSDAFVD